MLRYKKIKVGKRALEAIVFKLAAKNLIVIRGSKGYAMCGYLNLIVAQKFKEAAVIITGVTSVKGALGSRVCALTKEAKKLGIYKNQPIKDVLKIIA